MALRFAALASLLLTSSALAAPTTLNTRNAIVKKGFRTEARRYIPSNALIKRDTGAVATHNDGGGWTIPVLIGGQQMILNVDTGSSDL